MKIISRFLSFILLISLVATFMTSCGSKEPVQGEQGLQGEPGVPGKDGVDGESPYIGENGNWWVGDEDTGVYAHANDGKDGTNGKNGKDGQDGQDGEDGITPIFSFDSEANLLSVSYDSGQTWSPMIDLNGMCQDGKDGKDGADGKDGINGKDGVNGITPILSINEVTNFWTVSYDGGLTWTSLNVPATGEKGDPGKDGTDGKDGKNGVDGTNGRDGKDGKDGVDGITPLIQINPETFTWEISTDNGDTWQDTGMSAVGKNGAEGAPGEDGKDGAPGKDGETPELYVEGGKLYVKYPSTDRVMVYDFSFVTDAKDGVTPTLRINTDTFMWEVSYDNAVSWEELGVSAVGKSGEDGEDGKDGAAGADGTDGKTPHLVVIDNVLYVYYDDVDSLEAVYDFSDISADSGSGNGTDGKDGVTPRLRIENGIWEVSYDNGTSWVSLEVEATGNDGKDGISGKDGVDGKDGENGKDGVDGKDGKDGADGRGIVSTWIEDGYLLIEYTDGTTEVAGYIGAEETGGGSVVADFNVYTDSLDFYPLNNGEEYGVAIGRAVYMTKIEIPAVYAGKPVTQILERGFDNAYNLEEVIIPSTVKIIGAHAFDNCTSLTVEIPNSVEKIGENAFDSVHSVTLPTVVKEINELAFFGVEMLIVKGSDTHPEWWPEFDSVIEIVYQKENN